MTPKHKFSDGPNLDYDFKYTQRIVVAWPLKIRSEAVFPCHYKTKSGTRCRQERLWSYHGPQPNTIYAIKWYFIKETWYKSAGSWAIQINCCVSLGKASALWVLLSNIVIVMCERKKNSLYVSGANRVHIFIHGKCLWKYLMCVRRWAGGKWGTFGVLKADF